MKGLCCFESFCVDRKFSLQSVCCVLLDLFDTDYVEEDTKFVCQNFASNYIPGIVVSGYYLLANMKLHVIVVKVCLHQWTSAFVDFTKRVLC